MRESAKPQELRCAIYTRKSSEEGLEQDFNSLHAQREACQAYIKSQKHEGWRPLSAHYDDGGYSGGTLDRPALRRLLADIQAKRIDIVVVYKVDRLTRPLADFAKIVEVFDASGRELRLRHPGLQHHHLDGAADSQCASLLRPVRAGGHRRAAFTSASNKTWGDRPFSRGHLYRILSNPIYAGKIVHNDKQHDGQHEAIIDRKTFGAVQTRLAANNRQHRNRVRAKEPNLLAGLLFGSDGKPLTSSHTVKDGKRYRYYVGTHTGQGKPKPWRVPAHEIESAVLKAARDFLGDRQRVATALKRSRLQARKLKNALEIASDLSAQINLIGRQRETAFKLIKKVVVSDFQLAIEVKLDALMSEGTRVPQAATHRFTIPIDLGQLNGGAIVITSASDRGFKSDPALVKGLARGFAWFEEVATGGADTVTAIAKREHVTDRYVSQLVELAFVDPCIVRQALAGTARSTISTTSLVLRTDLPLIWSEQKHVILVRPPSPSGQWRRVQIAPEN